MADTEFEQFRFYFDRLPQHFKAPSDSYTLVHDVMLDESPTSSQESDNEVGRTCANAAEGDSDDEDVVVLHRHGAHSGRSSTDEAECEQMCCSSIVADSDFSCSSNSGGLGVARNRGRDSVLSSSDVGDSCSSLTSWPTPEHQRRRRRLPEIPVKNKRSMQSSPSLAEELDAAAAAAGRPAHFVFRKSLHQRHEDSSPDSERLASCTDSGHSTAHSPDNGPKSVSPLPLPASVISNEPDDTCDSTPGSSGSGVPFTRLELLEATHRGLHKFVPRHRDEIDLEIGDPIYVQKEADDLWCEGVNLRTGRQGIFPSAYAVDMDYSDFDPAAPKIKKERYLLGYLGSVETQAHKGTSVVCQAVRRIVGGTSSSSSSSSTSLSQTLEPPPPSQSCILEVSDQGLRMLDRSKPQKSAGPCHDYFYSLKNVSFCAFHPRDHRYLGFITKHPTLQRFACHVFIGQESTRPVAEAVGRAFHRFYTKFVETAFPIEDIYIE